MCATAVFHEPNGVFFMNQTAAFHEKRRFHSHEKSPNPRTKSPKRRKKSPISLPTRGGGATDEDAGERGGTAHEHLMFPGSCASLLAAVNTIQTIFHRHHAYLNKRDIQYIYRRYYKHYIHSSCCKNIYLPHILPRL